MKDEDEHGAATVIVYGVVAFVGAVVGFLIGLAF